MNTNDTARDLIIRFEGFRTESYPDPGSPLARELSKAVDQRSPNLFCLPGDPWTIGIGATGKGIVPGLIWSKKQVWARFESDLLAFEKQINKVLLVPLNLNQFSALVCFLFNVGIGNLSESTLLRKLNNGDYLGAAAEFERWDNSCTIKGCIEVEGLRRRRLAEQTLFLTPANKAVA